MNKRLLIFQDIPKTWKDFSTLKTITGESKQTGRGFMQDTVTFENKLKIWASGNYLPRIPIEEQDAMYTRRLSLIHNTKAKAYKEDPHFAKKIVEREKEKIISWIINIDEGECIYEIKEVLQNEWERVASPEIEYINTYYEISDGESSHSVMSLANDFKEKYHQTIPLELMTKALKSLGYTVIYNVVKNIKIKPIPKKTNPQTTF